MIKIIMPWNNLGCTAVVTKKHYVDMFVRPYWGVYVHNKTTNVRRWYKLPRFKLLRTTSPKMDQV